MSALLQELVAIRDRRGELSGEVVVEESTPLDAPLHNRFEWDDAKAGHAHRVTQAQALIRSVKIEFRAPTGEAERTRAFVSVARTDGKPTERTYEHVEAVAQDPETVDWVQREMQRDIARLVARYRSFDGFLAALQSAIDGLNDQAA